MSVITRKRERAAPARRVPSMSRSLRALLRRGLRDQRRASLSWGGSLGAMSALVAAMYPSIQDSLAEAVKGYPEGLKEAFGIRELDTAEAYLDAEMFSLIVPVALSFFAARAVTRAIVGAEERGHLDVVLSAPLSRRRLVAGAFASTALSLVAVLAVLAALTWIAGALAGADLSLGATVAAAANVWPLALLFAGVAVLACGVLHRSAPVTAIATGVLVGMYVIDVLGRVAEPMEPLRWASAFRYYGSAITSGIDPAAFAGLALLGAILAAAGALLFERRDVLA